MAELSSNRVCGNGSQAETENEKFYHLVLTSLKCPAAGLEEETADISDYVLMFSTKP